MSGYRAVLGVLAAAWITACALGPPVSFERDVTPVLEANCFPCHTAPDGEGYREAGLNLASWETLIKGGLYGPVLVPGDSRHSVLNMLVEGRADSSLRMPHEADEPLAPADIDTLRRWVDQGAKDN